MPKPKKCPKCGSENIKEVEIVDGILGGREKYLAVVRELQLALYS